MNKALSHFKKIALFVFVAAALLSCQKEPAVIIDLPSVVTDSTQLVKQILYVEYDGAGEVFDSLYEDYSYDTVSRKIMVKWTDTFSGYMHGVSAVFSYDSRYLLSQVAISYPSVYPYQPEDEQNVAISYDDAGIIKSLTVTTRDAQTNTRSFTKKATGAGYELTWVTSTDPQEVFNRSVLFDANGKFLKNTFSQPLFDINGDRYSTYVQTDSVIYDGSDNIQKIYSHNTDTAVDIDNTFLAYEFNARGTKGNQLYLQRSLLLNGLSNIPFTDLDDWFELSVLTMTVDDYQDKQYSKYPFTSGKVYNQGTNSLDATTGQATFDSKDRLTGFKGYFQNNSPQPLEYHVSYYK